MQVSPCDALPCTATHCNNTATTHLILLQYTNATHMWGLKHVQMPMSVAHCNTLQQLCSNTASTLQQHCNTLIKLEHVQVSMSATNIPQVCGWVGGCVGVSLREHACACACACVCVCVCVHVFVYVWICMYCVRVRALAGRVRTCLCCVFA